MPLNVQNPSIKARANLVKQVLQNMGSTYRSLSNTSLMLAGDPGIGKTSFIHQLTRLLGLELILIEVPHIVEEHLINVPFIVFDNDGSQKKKGAIKLNNDENYEIVLARSNLSHQIAEAKQMSAPHLLKQIYADENLRALHEKLGGTKTDLPEIVQDIRNRYTTVLFIDEYFRQTSTAIRNVLRGILNGRIGMDKLPEHAYVVYASNMHDDGVEDVPTNQDFDYINMKAPTKDEWFSWLVNKFKSDQNVKLNMDVINTFYDALEDADISSNDIGSEVRTSPRRWEQLLLYINAALPVADAEQATHLMTNIESTFKNYQTGERAEIYTKIEKALRKAIKLTSNIEPSGSAKPTTWRSTLDQQIKVKMKLGGNRTYIPVISGPPGIGKTRAAFDVAEANNLRYIYVDCSQLTPDDVIGLPLPKGKGQDVGVGFSKPKLFMMLEKEIQQADEHYKASPDADPDYDSARWKYLIFFDEMNRVKNVNTFNAIRKLLLDKKFNDELKLPEESIVIAAINPADLGTLPLTSHMRDVLDVLPTAPDWSEYVKVLKNSIKDKNPTLSNAAFEILNKFAESFHDKRYEKVSPNERKFYLSIGDGDEPLYISPREYTQLYANILAGLESLFKYNKITPQTLEDEDFAQEMMEECDNLILNAFEGVMTSVLTKHKVQAPDLMNTLAEWLKTINPIRETVSRKTEVFDFRTVAEDFFHNHGKSMSNDPELINYFNTVSPAEFAEDLTSFLNSKFDTLSHVQEHLLDLIAKQKVRADLEIKTMDKQVSLLENFVTDLVHSIKIHNLSNEFVETTRETFIRFLKKLGQMVNNLVAELQDEDAGMDIIMQATSLVTKLSKFIKNEMATA